MTDPHTELIETVCNDVLPNMVRVFESGKMNIAVDRDMFVRILEQKIDRANKSLKMLSAEDQVTYRGKIDRAYADTIDRIRKEMPIPQAAGANRVPIDHC